MLPPTLGALFYSFEQPWKETSWSENDQTRTGWPTWAARRTRTPIPLGLRARSRAHASLLVCPSCESFLALKLHAAMQEWMPPILNRTYVIYAPSMRAAGEQKPAFPPGDPDQNSQAPQEHHTWAPQKPHKFFSRPFGCTPMTLLMATVYPILYNFTEIAWHACQAQYGCRSVMHHAARALHDMVAASDSNYHIIGCKQPCKRVQALTESHDSAG